jgi:two-component sensor histidine kinase
MTIEHLPYSADSPLRRAVEWPERRTVASYERELREHRHTQLQLRQALVREEALLRQKDELIRQQEILSKESDHRLLNGLQMIVSLLSLQSRTSLNADTSSQLTFAANRVAMIARVHRRLHCLDGTQTVAFKQYIEGLCRDFSTLLSSEWSPERTVVVDAIEIELPSATAIPLGFIVSELITNAAKYGKGRIAVSLKADLTVGYALSVSNDGQNLSDGFDPAAAKGLGMRIVRSLVKQIGGHLRFGGGDNNQGARFTVLFA